MTRQEAIKLIALLKTMYPTHFRNFTKEDYLNTSNVYYELFGEYDFVIVLKAFEMSALQDKVGFIPPLGIINENIQKIIGRKVIDVDKALEMIRAAASRGNYNAVEEFDKLPQLVKEVVGSSDRLREWAMMNSDTFNTVIMSNLRKSLVIKIENHKINLGLPRHIKEFIESIRLIDYVDIPNKH